MGLLYLLLNGVEEPDIFVYLFIYVIIYSVNNLVKFYGRTHVLTSGASFALQLLFFFLWRCDPTRVMASSFFRFLDHTQRRTTVGRTPLDE